ncbi:MAG: hypothetical protein ACI8WT_001750 [Clostridium sp.]|jgi:hypothetical protein
MITIDSNKLKEVEKQLGQFKGKAPSAISRALNRAAANAKTNASKKAREKYIIKSSDIKSSINVSKATKSNLGAAVVSKGERLGLHKFKVSPKIPRPKNPPKGLKISVKKGSGKKLLHAFIADINGGKVFERTSKSRLPIRQLYGPAIPQMLGNISIKNYIESESAKVFNERLDHEIKNILEGVTK